MTMVVQHAGRCLTLVLSKEIGLRDQAQGKVLKVTLSRQAEPRSALLGHRMRCTKRESKGRKKAFQVPLFDAQSDQPARGGSLRKSNGLDRFTDVVASCEATHEFRAQRPTDSPVAGPAAAGHRDTCGEVPLGDEHVGCEDHKVT